MITSEIFVAHNKCDLKAYLLLINSQETNNNEFITSSRLELNSLKEKYSKYMSNQFKDVAPYSISELEKGTPVLLNPTISTNKLETHSDSLVVVQNESLANSYYHQPTLVISNYLMKK